MQLAVIGGNWWQLAADGVLWIYFSLSTETFLCISSLMNTTCHLGPCGAPSSDDLSLVKSSSRINLNRVPSARRRLRSSDLLLIPYLYF